VLSEEAKRIGDILKNLPLRAGQRVLDLGSASEEYRCLIQPYIDYYIFRPLRTAGAQIVHVDLEPQEGVDVVCDFVNANDLVPVLGKSDIVFCCNLLEHVVDREQVLTKVKEIVKKDGIIILTVPHIYPYHPLPIDTLYRPTNTELQSLLGEEFEIIFSEMVNSPSVSIGFKWGPIKMQVHRNVFMSILYRVLKRCKLGTEIPAEVACVVARKVH
jgi:SAM-dependent methyltransferase